MPLSLLLGGVSILLFYSILLTKRQIKIDLSTTIDASFTQGIAVEYESENNELPDPAEVGVETPIL